MLPDNPDLVDESWHISPSYWATENIKLRPGVVRRTDATQLLRLLLLSPTCTCCCDSSKCSRRPGSRAKNVDTASGTTWC